MPALVMNSIVAADVFRLIVILEITFGIGYLTARIWMRRRHPWRYLSLMAISLVLYSLFAVGVIIGHWCQPISWNAPYVFIAATVSTIAIVREGAHTPKQKKGGKKIDNSQHS